MVNNHLALLQVRRCYSKSCFMSNKMLTQSELILMELKAKLISYISPSVPDHVTWPC